MNLKASSPILVTLLGIVTVPRLPQSSNPYCPMVCTAPPIVKSVKVIHEAKALFPILDTPLPMVTLTKFPQLLNASFLIVFTLFGILIPVNRLPENVEASISLTPLGIIKLFIAQLLNAYSPILDTLLPTVTPVKLVHDANAI